MVEGTVPLRIPRVSLSPFIDVFRMVLPWSRVAALNSHLFGLARVGQRVVQRPIESFLEDGLNS